MNRTSSARPEVSLRLRPPQVMLAVLLVLVLGGIVWNSFHVSEQRAAESVFRLTTETSNANVVFTQRESTRYALIVERWLGQGATRREVQIARALLEQRLSVKDATGRESRAATSQAYQEALAKIDAAVAAQRPGLLDDHHNARETIQPLLDDFNAESRDLLTKYQQQADDRYRELTVASANTDRNIAWLLSAFFIGLITLLIWVGATTMRDFRAARQRITSDSEQLANARKALEFASAVERGQSQILERIAVGSPLHIIQKLIVDLAHQVSESHMSMSLGTSDVIACCGIKPVGESVTINFGHSATGDHAGNVQIYSGNPAPVSSDEIAIARRFADLATIAVERHANDSLLRQQASFDPLTGLANRALLLTRLEAALHRATRTGDVAVLYCDLDRFKPVNDHMGHEAGDILLKEAAQRLQKVVRSADTVARIGGDEFVLVCEGLSNPAFAEELAVRVQEALSTPFIIRDIPVIVDVSIGIAHATEATEITAAELINRADGAMYQAKASHKQRWAVVFPSPTEPQESISEVSS